MRVIGEKSNTYVKLRQKTPVPSALRQKVRRSVEHFLRASTVSQRQLRRKVFPFFSFLQAMES